MHFLARGAVAMGGEPDVVRVEALVRTDFENGALYTISRVIEGGILDRFRTWEHHLTAQDELPAIREQVRQAKEKLKL